MNTYFQRCAKFVICALILTLLMPGTYVEAESSQTKPVKLKVVLLPYLSFAPFFIAEEEGFFAEQGIEVEFVKMRGSSQSVPALLQGDLDVATSQIEFGILNAMAREGNLKIVADKGYLASAECPAYALLARRALVEAGELDTPAQLRGKRLAVEILTSEGYYVEKILREADLTFDDVKTKDIPPPVLSEALETGAIDLVNIGEPWITRLLRTGNALIWKPVKEVLPDFQWAVILYGPTLLNRNPGAGRRFMVAYLKAIRQYNQGKRARNVEILAKYTKLDRELLQEACWPTIRNDGHINVQSVLNFQNWGIEKGLLDSKVTEEQFWDNRFIEYANQLLGTPEK